MGTNNSDSPYLSIVLDHIEAEKCVVMLGHGIAENADGKPLHNRCLSIFRARKRAEN